MTAPTTTDTAHAAGPASGRRVTVTDAAARRIDVLVAAEGGSPQRLRLSVSGGGCSGFQYHFTLDAALNDDDAVFEHGGTAVVIDDCSLDLLGGAEIDFVEDLVGSSFRINNPNATSSCGCGSSFAV
ncbi:MAG: iron-sulfur cluster insertion protein ErpA [Azospirillum sp.]|nr:iron-sulfur cluster insertion protein ErpA [Azospirillum sp.]